MQSAQAGNIRQLLQHMLVLAAVYALLGRLSLLLAIPPGYSIAIYPPAGIALGMVLTGGYRLLPGVAAGAFLANILINIENFGALTPQAISISAIVAVGACLQAAIGCRLIRKKLGDDLSLGTDRAIFQFFILGGLLACLTNATIGVTSLVMFDILPWSEFINNWIGWWTGDTFGVLTIAPIVMVIYGKPREIWYARRWSVMLPLLICLLLVVTAFTFTRYREEQKQQLEFRLKAERVGQNLQNKLDSHSDIMRNIERLYASSNMVTRSDFATFVSHTIQNQKAISFLSWVPKVNHQQRENFEISVLREGFASFQIQEMDEQLHDVEASVRDEYYPVRFIEPFASNHQLFGYDMGSSVVRRNAIEDARDSGNLTVTDPLISLKAGDQQLHVLLFAPVYENGKPLGNIEQRKTAFSGTAVSMIRMGDVVKDILSNEDLSNVRIKFYDLSYPGKKGIFLDNIERVDNRYLFQSTINFGGKQYAFLAQPSSEYWKTHVAWITWITMIGGLLFTGLLGAYLLVATAHTFGIENLVAQRTAQLHNSEGRLRTILDNAAEGILTSDEFGVIESANRSAEVLLNYPHGGLPGTGMFSLFPDPDSRVFLSRHLRSTSWELFPQPSGDEPDRADREEVVAMKKDGSEVPVELAITTVKLGQQTLLVIIMHDLSEKKRIEKLKTEFVSAVSHELRTPLTSIRGVLGLLVGGVAGDIPDKARGMLMMANDNATRLTTLINDLLDFEKLEYGSMQFHFETVALGDLVQKTVQSNLGYAQNFGVGIAYEMSATQEINVRVDAQRFIQVLSNLLSNAIKFSREKGHVDLRVFVDDDQARVEVQDYGIGISEEFKSSIFQKFTQEDAKAARKYAGTGLGLSLSKTMIEKMGGQIGFTSVETQGSVFFIILPIFSVSNKAAAMPSATDA